MTVQAAIIAAIVMDIVVLAILAIIMTVVTYVVIPILVVMDARGSIVDVVGFYLSVQTFNV